MDQTKRSSDHTIDDNKRKKLEGRRHIVLLTISYSLFLYDVYIGFSNLNQRFKNLINSILRISIDISLYPNISKNS